MDTKPYRSSSTLAGLLLIVLGLVFFAVTQGALDLDWGNIWPVFPMLAGLFILGQAFIVEDRRRRAGLVLGGTIPFLLGVFFFMITVGPLEWGNMGTLWPVYPLIVGVAFFAAYLASGREQSGLLVPAFILSAIGLIFLAVLQVGGSYAAIGTLWPIFLILAGVLLLVAPMVRRARG